MIKTCLPALLLLTACTSPAWRAYKIDKHLTVYLPKQPQPVNLQGMRFSSPATQQTANSADVRMLTATDGANAYGIVINTAALPADLKQPVVPDSFYNQAIRNTLEREHKRVLKRSIFTTPAGQGVEVEFGPTSAADRAAVQYVRTVLVGRACYTLIFQPNDSQGAGATERGRHFLNSITIKP
jgi:hypothetical protein